MGASEQMDVRLFHAAGSPTTLAGIPPAMTTKIGTLRSPLCSQCALPVSSIMAVTIGPLEEMLDVVIYSELIRRYWWDASVRRTTLMQVGQSS